MPVKKFLFNKISSLQFLIFLKIEHLHTYLWSIFPTSLIFREINFKAKVAIWRVVYNTRKI